MTYAVETWQPGNQKMQKPSDLYNKNNIYFFVSAFIPNILLDLNKIVLI